MIRRLRPSRALAAACAAVAALTFAATATAGGQHYTVRRTATDDAAARAAVLTKADLGGNWTGGVTKPNLSGDLGCASYQPKVSDLVIVGAAATRWAQPGLVMSSDSQIFRTPAMVESDWQRGPGAPKFTVCLSAAAKKASNAGTSHFVSFRKLSLPRIGAHAAGYRTTFDVKTKVGKVRLAVDIVAVTQGRNELSLTTTMALASAPTLYPNELVLLKTLLGRAHA